MLQALGIFFFFFLKELLQRRYSECEKISSVNEDIYIITLI